MTCTAASRVSSESTPVSTCGARSRASGRSSAVYVRSTIAASGGSPASSSAFRAESADDARKITRASDRLSASSPPTIAGSSPTRVSRPASSWSAAIRRRAMSRAEVATMSRISRPSSVALPTRAAVLELANLMLRGPAMMRMSETPADDTAEPDYDPAADVRDCHCQQHRLRPVPDRVDPGADRDDQNPLIRLVEVQPLEAVVPPRADHQESEQCQQREPRGS